MYFRINEGVNQMIDKEEFRDAILAGCTIPQLQEIYGISRGKVAQYKRDFGFVGLTPNSKKLDRDSGEKLCGICSQTLPLSRFYSNGTSSTGLRKYKPSCIQCENAQRKETFSSKILAYLTRLGKPYACEKCAYTGVWGSLDFHHIDPKAKDFNIGDSGNLTISDERFSSEIEPELNKCQLLCPNCHRQEHILMGWK